MSEAFLSHLFEPFEQERVSGGQSYGGTGLGMPITKNLVTLMGGTISVKSKLGQGSTFTIELDFDLQNEDADAQEQKPHAILGSDRLGVCGEGARHASGRGGL